MSDIESQEFYELMQTYRHTPVTDQEAAVMAYEAVKSHVRSYADAKIEEALEAYRHSGTSEEVEARIRSLKSTATRTK
jgi:lipopolysaccharide biosynthesis regulator YciM